MICAEPRSLTASAFRRVAPHFARKVRQLLETEAGAWVTEEGIDDHVFGISDTGRRRRWQCRIQASRPPFHFPESISSRTTSRIAVSTANKADPAIRNLALHS